MHRDESDLGDRSGKLTLYAKGVVLRDDCRFIPVEHRSPLCGTPECECPRTACGDWGRWDAVWDTVQYLGRGYLRASDLSAQAFCDVELLIGAMHERRQAHREELLLQAERQKMGESEAKRWVAEQMAELG